MAVGILLLYLSPQIVAVAIDGFIDHKSHAQRNPLYRFIHLLAGDSTVRALWIAGALVVLVTALSGCFAYLKGRWSALASESIARSLREKLYDHLQHVPVSYHDSA